MIILADSYAGLKTHHLSRLIYCKDGRLINADINGSYNIMRKGLKKASLDDKIISYSECRGFVYNPDKFNLR